MVRRRRVENTHGAPSHALSEIDIEISLLSTEEEWFYLRIELHDALKGRVRLGDASKMPLRKVVQLHAILDKIDAENKEKMEELKKTTRNSKFRR